MKLCSPILLLALLPVPLLAASRGPTQAPAQEAGEVPAPRTFQPRVEDPMLAPAPQAPVTVGSWEEALTRLRERSTDLRVAEAGVDRAAGRSQQALSALLPNARASAGVAYDLLNPDNPVVAGGGGLGGVAGGTSGGGASPTVPLATATATVTQSLVDVAAWRGLSATRAAEASALANQSDVQRRLTQGLARVLVATVAAERAAELNRVGLRQALERAALAQRTFELGAANQLDVVRVRQDVEVAREALVSGDEQLRRAREALGLSLGQDQAVGVSSSFQLDGLVASTATSCAPLDALGDRPDLVAAREQVKAARASREQASAGYLPTFGLQSSVFGLTTSPYLGRIATWNIAAVLSVPIFEGGLRGGLVRERRGVEVQSAEVLEQTRRDVSIEVDRSRRGVEVAQSLVETANRARELAEKTDQLTRRAFEVGRGSSLELVQSGAALRRAELTQALREFELVQARLDSFLTEARCDW